MNDGAEKDDGFDPKALRWVDDPGSRAPGLDALLVHGYRLGASRGVIQSGKPVFISTREARSPK